MTKSYKKYCVIIVSIIFTQYLYSDDFLEVYGNDFFDDYYKVWEAAHDFVIDYRQQKFRNMSLSSLIEKFGKPTEQEKKPIGYSFDTMLYDPEYSNYFSEQELKNSVVIITAYWHLGFVNIKV